MDTPRQRPDTQTPRQPTEEYLYDATLIQVDELRGLLIFKVDEAIHRVTCPHLSSFSVGAIGRLRLPNDERPFAFNAYPDQRLRRAPSLDQPQDRRWGWRIGERQFTVEASVMPGRAGKVIRRDTLPLSLEVPSEFESFCKSRGVASYRVLSAFIADVCALTNSYGVPREDGYSATGDDSHQHALAYFNCTWGEESTAQRGTRRGVRQSPRNSSE